jgi:UTP--glucose-1-phosphate uridylyltransferase
MNRVKTAVIPVAGLGTRLLPASKAIPKELVPVVDKPVIQYVVEEAVAAGITRIVLVTRSGKEAIENHFDRHFELESELERKGKTTLLRRITNTVPDGVELLSVRQPRAVGLGDAIRCAASAIGDEPFAVMLPDVLVHTRLNAGWNMKHMIDRFEKTQAAQILVEPVPANLVDQYGIVDCDRKLLQAGGSARIFDMLEKPPVSEAPSDLAIVGRYILPPLVLEILKSTGRGAGGEIQLTDAMTELLERSPMEALMMRGRTYDCGNKAGYMQANIALSLEDEDIGLETQEFLASMFRKRAADGMNFQLSEVA